MSEPIPKDKELHPKQEQSNARHQIVARSGEASSDHCSEYCQRYHETSHNKPDKREMTNFDSSET